LTRHFLRRFLDNDLISPHIDLHENVVVILAGIVATSIFLSFLLSMKYLAGYPAPAMTAIYALGDKSFFLAASMIVMALVAAMQWDALSLDARDRANLSPLPIARRTLVAAKIAALIAFASSFALALTVAPAFIHSILHVTRLRVPMSVIVQVLVTQLGVTLAACCFGFAAVVGLRESLRAVLGERWFRKISPLLQALLVLFLLSVFLLLPGLAQKVAESWPERGFPNAHLIPPLWFLGLWATLSGHVIATLHFEMPARVLQRNDYYLAQYQANVATFGQLARTAVVSFAAVVLGAIAAYAHNTRRLPQPVAASQRHRYGIDVLTAIFAGTSPVRAAGFSLALRAVARSAPHRLAIAAAAAAALAMSFAMLSTLAPLRVLSHQTAVVAVLLIGFRHAVRTPADLRASWIFHIAWSGEVNRYLSGIKRAGIVGCALPAILVLSPLAVFVLGYQTALAHAAVGAFLAVALTEILFLQRRQLPLISAYVPGGNVKTLGPIAVIAFFIFVAVFARIERWALASLEGTVMLLAVLAIVFIAARVFNAWTGDTRGQEAFEEPPEAVRQWLGLSH
jgi:hypothetical protein